MSAPLTTPITGATRFIGIIGHPIAQVKAPEVWTELFRRNGLNMACVPIHVLPENLDAVLPSLKLIENFAGFILTIPHKPAGVRHADLLTPRAELVQSVNLLTRDVSGAWTGDIVDGIGFVQNLVHNDMDPKGKRTLLVGTGGVGTAIAFALAEQGVSELVVYDVNETRAKDIATRLRDIGTKASYGPPDPENFQVVVNASPVGMKPDDPLPVDVNLIASDAYVADVIVEDTQLLIGSAEKGCRTVNGVGMMNSQLAHMARSLGLESHDFSRETANNVSAEIAAARKI